MTLHATIASVNKTHFEGEVESLTVPGVAGEMTILAQHEPLISTLKEGTIVAVPQSGERVEIPVERGVLEVSKSRATVLL